MTVVHHTLFCSDGRVYGYTMNNMVDKHVEISLTQDFFKPARPHFDFKCNQYATLPDVTETTTPTTTNPGGLIDDDDITESNTDNPNGTEITLESTKRPIQKVTKPSTNCHVSKKGKLQRIRMKNLDVVNSIVLIPPAILEKLIALKQPFERDDIHQALKDLDYEMSVYTPTTEVQNAHQLTLLVYVFIECTMKGEFHHRSSIQQIRDKSIITLLHKNTFPVPATLTSYIDSSIDHIDTSNTIQTQLPTVSPPTAPPARIDGYQHLLATTTNITFTTPNVNTNTTSTHAGQTTGNTAHHPNTQFTPIGISFPQTENTHTGSHGGATPPQHLVIPYPQSLR
jgi:hypothetical protein